MQRIKFLFYGIALIVLSSCASNKIISRNEDNEVLDAEYYGLFTEATKQALINGNYSSAIALYKQCIRIYPEQAAPYYQLSNIYATNNDLKLSKYYAKKSVEFDNENKWYFLHLANIYQYEDNIDSVIYCYENIVKVSDDLEYKYNLSVFYGRSGDYEKSLKIVDELENVITDAKEILLIKHSNFSALNLKDSAIFQLEKIIQLFPDEIENYGLLAEYLAEINRTEYAGKVYNELLIKDPDNGLANISYADFLYRQGKKSEAYKYYMKGFSEDDIDLTDKITVLYGFVQSPVAIYNDSILIDTLLHILISNYTDFRPYTIAAEYNIKRNNYTQALPNLKSAIDLGSDAYIVWEQYIMLSNFLNEYEGVENIYIDAIKKFPDEVNLYVYSGFSLFQLEKYDSVIQTAKKGLNLIALAVQDRIQLLNLMADSYREKADYERSDSLFEEILFIDPENLLIRNNYSYYLSVRGKDLERAEELSKLTIVREPKNATYLDTYAWILYKMGEYEASRKYIEDAIKYGAYNSGEVLDHYAEIMVKMKKCAEAVEAWNEAIKYDSENSDFYLEKIEKVNMECNE